MFAVFVAIGAAAVVVVAVLLLQFLLLLSICRPIWKRSASYIELGPLKLITT